AITAEGCGDTTAGADFGVVEPGCRAPSACYKLGSPCQRGDVDSTCLVFYPPLPLTSFGSNPNPDARPGVVRTCPQAGPAGRGPVCAGLNARCVPTGAGCDSAGATAPQLVQGAGGALEARCAFVDDQCCPGLVLDFSVSDLSESD